MKLATVNMEKVETHQRESEGDFVSRVKFQGDVQLGVAHIYRRKYGLDNSYSILRMYRNCFYRKRMEEVRRKYE